MNRCHVLLVMCFVAVLLGLRSKGHAGEKQPRLQIPDEVRAVRSGNSSPETVAEFPSRQRTGDHKPVDRERRSSSRAWKDKYYR